jgi:predicted phage terminase large subunit-like protein
MTNSNGSWPTSTRPRHLARMLLHRSMARIDPNRFIPLCFTTPAGGRVRQAAVHVELQDFLSRHPKALVELPRDHGKSFQVCCRIVWELGRNPGLRVKVVCATDAVAAERARFLRDAIAHNGWVRQVFPGLVPARPWAADAFTVKRPADLIGPSVAAFGVGAGSTGTRADLLVCDDIVDVRALHSRAERDRVADYFENNLMNLLEPDGRFWGLCTPWHSDDVNARLKRNGAYALFRRAVGPDLEPVWPAKWPPERLALRKAEVGAASFARGYRLVPLAAEETPIRPEWVRFWTEPAAYECVLLSVDPAVTAGAKADASALVVLGKTGEPGVLTPGSLQQIHVLEAAARRVSAPELVGLIDDLDRRWTPDVILFESNAAFAGIRDLLIRHARFGPRVKGVTQSRDKAARVAALSVPVENGSVRLKGDGAGGVDAGQRPMFEEMTTFPFAGHDDLLDALGTGVAHLLDRREPRVW